MKNRVLSIAVILFVSSTWCQQSGLAQDPSDGFDEREREDARTAVQTQPMPANETPNAPRSVPFPSSSLNPLASHQQSPFGVATAPSARSFGSTWPAMSREVAQSNVAVNDLIRKLQTAKSDTEKEKIKNELKTELEHQYDLYLDQHEAPLKQLEEKLAKLREEFNWRKSARDDLVKLRLDTIWYNSQGLGWPGQKQNALFGPPQLNNHPGLSLTGSGFAAPRSNSPVPPRPASVPRKEDSASPPRSGSVR